MNNICIRDACADDFLQLCQYDKHVDHAILREKIERHEVLIILENQEFAGWLRYGLFWDNTPFMNLLFLLPQYRGRGFGRALVTYWEAQMKALGYDTVLTSTQQNETAQHFYVALGYQAVGGFFPSGEPYEILLAKRL
jgi:ribosomal protein S18 acetylase RimI-like enzyme